MTPGLATPALVVNEATVRRNVATADALLAAAGKTVRPHMKCHRVPALTRMALTGHASGVTCATVGEAEVAVDAGFDDVLVANEIVAPDKLERLAALVGRAQVSVAVDSLEGARRLSRSARSAAPLHVLVDVDVGLGRCGVRELDEAHALAAAIARAPGLRLRGVMGYEGRFLAAAPARAARIAAAHARLAEIAAGLERAGFALAVVSAGGTSTMPEALAAPRVTEVQAGSYAVMDRELDGLDLPFAAAARVVATVVSVRNRLGVLDAGRKSVSCDRGMPACGAGRVIAVMEEHTTVEWTADPPPLGSTAELWPMGMATTFNLHDRCWLEGVDGRVSELAVAARGRSD